MSATPDAPVTARYTALARLLLAAPDPVTAIAHELGDHAGRLDALCARIDHLEAVLLNEKAARR